MQSVLVPAPNIRVAEIEDDVFILNLDTGTYLVFQPPQSIWWKASLDQPHWAIDSAGLNGFVSAMVAKGLLVFDLPGSRPRERSARRSGRPSTMMALYYCVATSRMIRTGRFPMLYRHLLLAPRRQSTAPAHLLASVEQAYLRAETLLPFGKQLADCLPRSLALFRLCVHCGVAAEHVIGIKRAPFGAHAWVRVYGRCVLDDSEFIRGFTPIATIQG